MSTGKDIDWATTIPNLIGSLSSFLGAGFILLCYCLLPQKRHFRHALIINLAIADFTNALNNSSSGLWLVIRQTPIVDSPACVANGFIGQLSVQATDCSILMIAIITLLSLRQVVTAQDASLMSKVLVCATAWVLPVITSFIALGLDLYHPVRGNWCWIQSRPTYMRYVLTHMWRFVVILGSSGIYIYIYLHLKRHFKKIKVLGGQSYGADSQVAEEAADATHSRKGSIGLRRGSSGFRKLSGKLTSPSSSHRQPQRRTFRFAPADQSSESHEPDKSDGLEG
jgi:hypothetical protein